MKKKFLKLVIIILLMNTFAALAIAQDGFQLYYQAKKLLYQREYDQALQTFDSLKTLYPDSKFLDDAEFWSGYILQRQKKYTESFRSYENLKKQYPTSAWVDDAEIQQIGIAEKMATTGDRKYIDFLVNKLHSADKSIKYQASVSLGKLNDPRALPGLRQIANNGDRDMGRMAKSLIQQIESKKTARPPKGRIIRRPPQEIQDREINKRTMQPSPKKQQPKGTVQTGKKSLPPKSQQRQQPIAKPKKQQPKSPTKK